VTVHTGNRSDAAWDRRYWELSVTGGGELHPVEHHGCVSGTPDDPLLWPASSTPRPHGDDVIILGAILLILGFLLKISILWTIGIILLVIGLVLLLLGTTGRAVGGRRHFF
jgi:hypothetical protein